MLTWIATQVAAHVPAAIGWAAAQAGKILIEKAKRILTNRAQTKAYGSAVSAALKRFGKARPDLVASFFDQHFLEVTVADEMLKLLTRSSQPDASRISEEYSKQFPRSKPADIQSAVFLFLRLCEEELSRHEELQTLLTNRQVHESVTILRRLDQRDEPRAVPELDAVALLQEFESASQAVLRWPRFLDSGEWLERPELKQLLSRIDESVGSVSLLLGLPGSGKSALLSQLCSDCTSRDWAVLAIKADQLPESLATLEDLRRFLELPAQVAECLGKVAEVTKTVLVIDQLDALSELVDLKSQRLQVLLRLITEARKSERLHIVASCRSFDRTYDSRLNSIEAEEVTLELPPWESIEKTLQARGVTAKQWPEAFREILRVPQCLKLFVRHFSGQDEQRIFESYQAMLEHLWSTRLLGPAAAPGAAEVLLDIATEMAEREVMFVPSAKFDRRRHAVNHAAQAGFLQYDATGRQITFSHQTIFDFARARAFIAKEQSLSRYVLARQSGLYVRPKLWSALHYLRGSDVGAYEMELRAIWNYPDLRPHVRMLLIDFLGLQEVPSSVEIEILRPMFEDKLYAAHALSAVAGRKAWFTVVDRGSLSKAMADEGMAWPASRVLEAAWGFASDRALELIKAHWVATGKWTMGWQSLRSVTCWDRNVLDVALMFVRKANVHASAVNDLASLASAQAPDLAVELVAAFVDKQIAEAIASRTPEIPLPEDADENEALVAHLERQNRDELRKIIDSSSEWYELPAVAEAAPKAFLWTVWPPVRTALEVLARESGGAATYRPDYVSATRFEVDSDRSSREHPFMDSFVYAVRALGSQDPDALRVFVEANKDSESATVHRLLAIGLCEGAAKLQQFALDYLLEDVRRLSLENFHEDERETKMLIRALAPHLSAAQLSTIEQYILSADIYKFAAAGKTVQERRVLNMYNRKFRLRLLLQFPRDKLAKSSRELIESELRLFEGFRDDRREVEVYASASAMSSEAMAKARPETIEEFLATAPDSTEWGDDNFPRRKGGGGSIQAARAFAEFAKGDAAKALKVIASLDPLTQQRPAAYAIRELKRENLDDSQFIQLIKNLDATGFSGGEFRECCASALRERVTKDAGLPEGAILLLEKWLAEYTAADEGDSEQLDAAKEQRASVLWGRDGFHVLPSGSYPILNAWFYGLLARSELDSSRILRGLRQHLSKGDTFRVWRAMAGDALTKLHFLDRAEAAVFLEQLFAAHPRLLGDRAGQVLIARTTSWVPPHLHATWVDQVRTSSSIGPQAYGELVTLRYVVLGDEWSTAALYEIMGLPASAPEPDELVGALYAAANLWSDSRKLDTLSKILCRGMNAVRKDAGVAAIEWFSRIQELRIGPFTRPILEALANGTTIETVKSRTDVLDRLVDVLDDAPDIVGRVSQRIIDVFKNEIGNLASGAALQSETLLSIALTLQRHDEPHRSVGLELFEQLLRYEAYRARDVLRDIDRRPGVAVTQTQLRARRRRRKNAKGK